ncbi:MAG: peptidyl-prolyl cis-trans isomerase [Myxococcales bacterium]
MSKRPARLGRGWTAFAVLVATLLVTGAGCRGHDAPPSSSTARSSNPSREAVARVDDAVITAADVQERVGAQPPVTRAQFASPEKKRELVLGLVNFELLAQEAARRGYDRDPDVVRALKQQMIAKMMQKDFDPKIAAADVPPAAIEAYYNQHAGDFNRPEQVQVSQMLIKDRARAARAAAQARALEKSDLKGFRDLVARYSEDQDSKTSGGEVAPFDRRATVFPAAVVEAAFALQSEGDISGPVPSDQGFRILRLTRRMPGWSRPLGEVTPQIQQQLLHARRTKAMEDFMTALRAKHTVVFDEAALARVSIDTAISSNQPIAPHRRRNTRLGLPGM